jgi:two-component system KDP operon response regulator KdpE
VKSLKSILIVDDDPQFRRVIHLALDSRGYEVEDAANGEEALHAVTADSPDLILLDWQLPGMDGIQTCRELRLSSVVPVIMISGNCSMSREAALDAGANDYLRKPFSVEDLLVRIKSTLQT